MNKNTEFKNQTFTTWEVIENKVFDDSYFFIDCQFIECIGAVSTEDCEFQNCTFKQCDFDIGTLESQFENCSFINNNFRSVYYSDPKFINCRFTKCEFGNQYSSGEYIECFVDLDEIENDFDKLEKELVIIKNIPNHFFLINEEPINDRWCILNYPNRIEVFYMSKNQKQMLKQFTSKQESINYFKTINFINAEKL